MRFRRKPTASELSGPVVESTVDIDAFARAVDPQLLDEKQFVQLIDMLDMLGRVGTGIELAAMRTDTFVWFVSRASTEQLEHLMEHPHLRAVVHWRLSGGAGPGGYDRFETVIENGTCTSGQDPTADARVTLTLSATDFLRAVTGSVNVAMLFMRGKVKVKGDIAFAAGLINYFDLPRP